MSIWSAMADSQGRRQCRRCGKMFSPRKEGQEYGPKCARKIAQIPIEARLDTDLTPLLRKKGVLIENADESAVSAYRGAVMI